jgi:hypothetical protein
MTLIKLEQLTSTNKIISCNQQKEIRGGSQTTEEKLWEGYASGSYNIKPIRGGELITFSPQNNGVTYSLYPDSGKVDSLGMLSS